jgi:hypothetical protein
MPTLQVCGGLYSSNHEQSISPTLITPHYYAKGKPVTKEYKNYFVMSRKILIFVLRGGKECKSLDQRRILSKGLPPL